MSSARTTTAEAPVSQKIAPSHSAESWRLEPHVCRQCFARIASHAAPTRENPGARHYECTNCGLSGTGSVPGVVCSCGIRLRKPLPGKGGDDAGVRCQPNPDIRPGWNSLYIAAPPLVQITEQGVLLL